MVLTANGFFVKLKVLEDEVKEVAVMEVDEVKLVLVFVDDTVFVTLVEVIVAEVLVEE